MHGIGIKTTCLLFDVMKKKKKSKQEQKSGPMGSIRTALPREIRDNVTAFTPLDFVPTLGAWEVN